MKPTMYIAVFVMAIFIILSLPILSVLWFLGATKSFNNMIRFASKTCFEDDDKSS